jgi:hypothetical protein
MSATSETNTGMSRRAEQQTLIVLGVLLQFLSTPEQINDQISVMHRTVPSGVVIPLHSHADPEIFMCWMVRSRCSRPRARLRAGKQSMPATSFLSPEIAGTRSEILLPPPTTSITVSKQQLYSFFRELARPFDPHRPPAPPTPNEMQQLFSAARRYEYWLASPDENAAIGISLP